MGKQGVLYHKAADAPCDDLASYVDYPICKMLITLDPARRDAVCAAGKEQFAGRIDLYPSSPFFIEAVPLGVAKDRTLPPCWSGWA